MLTKEDNMFGKVSSQMCVIISVKVVCKCIFLIEYYLVTKLQGELLFVLFTRGNEKFLHCRGGV